MWKGSGGDDDGEDDDEEGGGGSDSEDPAQQQLPTTDRDDEIDSEEIPESEAIEESAEDAINSVSEADSGGTGDDDIDEEEKIVPDESMISLVDEDREILVPKNADEVSPGSVFVRPEDLDVPIETSDIGWRDEDALELIHNERIPMDDIDVVNQVDTVWVASNKNNPPPIGTDSPVMDPQFDTDYGIAAVPVDSSVADGEAVARTPEAVTDNDVLYTPRPSKMDAPFDEYRDALINDIEHAGVDVGEQDGDPDPGAYLRNPRPDSSELNFSVRGDRSGGLPDASFDGFSEGDRVKRQSNRGVEQFELESGETVFGAEGMTVRGDSHSTFNRERAAYTFFDAAGVRIPRHEFQEVSGGSGRSISREISGSPLDTIEFGADGTPEDTDMAELVDQTDPQQAMDHLSLHILSGNWDVTRDNLMVTDGDGGEEGHAEPSPTSGDGEEGNLVSFDIDQSARSLDKSNVIRGSPIAETATEYAAEALTAVGVDASQEDVWNNTRAMAQDMIRSGEFKRLTDAVAETEPELAKRISYNIAYAAADPDDVISG